MPNRSFCTVSKWYSSCRVLENSGLEQFRTRSVRPSCGQRPISVTVIHSSPPQTVLASLHNLKPMVLLTSAQLPPPTSCKRTQSGSDLEPMSLSMRWSQEMDSWTKVTQWAIWEKKDLSQALRTLSHPSLTIGPLLGRPAGFTQAVLGLYPAPWYPRKRRS